MRPEQSCSSCPPRSVEDPSKPLLKELHWLPVQQRVTYKISLLVYKTVHNKKPAYLQSLLIPYEPARCLRSKEHSLLTKRHFNKVAASRVFRHSAPEIWNKLTFNTHHAASFGTFKKLKDRTIYIRFQSIGRPSLCIRVVLPGEALHVNLTVLLLLLLYYISCLNYSRLYKVTLNSFLSWSVQVCNRINWQK